MFGILLGAPTLRLRGDYLAIVTLGFGEIVPQTFLNLSQWTGGPNGIGSLDQPAIGSYKFGFDALPYYFMVLGLIAFGVWVANNLRNSRLGRAWMAIREDELAAAHMGINTTTTKLAAFAMGASFSGLAGCALASKLQLVSPDQFGFNVSVYILAMLVLGGMGNIPGVIVGSLILSALDRLILPQGTNFLHGLGINLDLTGSRFLDLRRDPGDDDAVPARRADPEPPAQGRAARRRSRRRRRGAGTSALHRGGALTWRC